MRLLILALVGFSLPAYSGQGTVMKEALNPSQYRKVLRQAILGGEINLRDERLSVDRSSLSIRTKKFEAFGGDEKVFLISERADEDLSKLDR
ncbi:hypothetical protein [Pseudobacteriovorax antillogorgiicola]|uniref:Uncharacterized protein n=1 Tax=Pseudobacteriovorax antillogorgiicola TaxID=1513793 RepID=A0A1Y6CDY9_9BACT|nr:hypothetical protein [Pseudobacteriovorax antillogorgiicola]TCS51740.1 hypothetical protein EDD56_110125 [Pseudobacteriovorax antillogorgiicola]SMF49636.1 hypothetical protein SAMN06296036_11594 [Pseudobacteriovorax antillogorgiicola]